MKKSNSEDLRNLIADMNPRFVKKTVTRIFSDFHCFEIKLLSGDESKVKMTANYIHDCLQFIFFSIR